MNTTQEKINEVELLMKKEKVVRVYKRYYSLYLSLTGKTCREISEIVKINKNTVTEINKKYNEFGINALADKPYGGRKKILSDEQEANLKEMILTKFPIDLGFPAEYNWTAGIIVEYINKEYGYKYSIRGVTGMLKRLNLSYTRPTYVLAKADKEKQDEFKKEFEGIKKTF